MKIREISALLVIASLPVWAQSITYNQSPSRAFGQLTMNLSSTAPNLVEGKELFGPQSVAVDTSVSPSILYIADTGNNRVLAWKNASAITKGDKADKAIGQPDLITTRSGGPPYNTPSFLSSPTAIAVDASGNLYVADTGNNRILRYPKPLQQTGDFPTPDLVIGQTSLGSGYQANQGSTVPNAQTIALSGNSGFFRTALTFDKQGNLWFSDSGNNRVLRYPVTALVANATNVAANFVLGQTTFTTLDLPNPQTRDNKIGLAQPSGVAVSADGDVYVADGYNRVLYYKAPFSTFGVPATRILGVVIPTTADPNPRAVNGCPTTQPQPCDVALGSYNGSNVTPPEGLATLGNNLYVADTGNNRIVKYDTPDHWPAECLPSTTTATTCAGGSAFSPSIIQYVGQSDGQSVKVNRGQREAGNSSLSQPVGLTFAGTDLWITDTQNHRAIMFPGLQYTSATRLVGQLDWNFSAPNLLEGRELFLFNGWTGTIVSGGAGMAVDNNSNPPHLYIADTLNNRVLGFKDARKVKAGDFADIVIGQPDLLHGTANYATNDPASPTESTLFNPVGAAVDSKGDLYIADASNARVVRFSRPFDANATLKANLVLGQRDYFSKITDASSTTMRAPYGLAFTNEGHLLVSDVALNRVLLFMKPSGGDFSNGQAASAVFGQANMAGTATGVDRNRLNGPRGIAVDSSNRLYVCDTLNNRVSIFPGVLNGETDPPARFTPTATSPHGIAVNSRGEIWVTDPANNKVNRFPIYEDWFNAPTTPISSIPASLPFAVALDSSDNVIVAEATNRVSIFYIQATYRNSASYSQRGLAPGMLANIARFGPAFGATGSSAQAQSLPWPTTLGDVQVVVNGTPAPIYRTLADVVSFQVPKAAPVNSLSDFQLVRASTGEVLAAGSFPINAADPAFFTSNAQGTGQIAALNEDGSVNTAANPVGRGKIIALFGTGLGLVTGQPDDGQGASGAVATVERPRVAMSPGPGVIPDANVQYFGLAPGLPGVFQMNILIPDTVPPSNAIQVGFTYKDFFSTEMIDGTKATRLITTIAVK